MNKQKKFDYTLFPVGTIFRVGSTDHFVMREYEGVDFAVQKVSRNGPRSYVIQTTTPETWNPEILKSFNTSWVTEIVKRGAGPLILDEHRYSEFEERVYTELGVGKHHSQYHVHSVTDLVLKIATPMVPPGQTVNFVGLAGHLINQGFIQKTLPYELYDGSRSHLGFKVNKKKFKQAVRRNLNRFLMNLKVIERQEAEEMRKYYEKEEAEEMRIFELKHREQDSCYEPDEIYENSRLENSDWDFTLDPLP